MEKTIKAQPVYAKSGKVTSAYITTTDKAFEPYMVYEVHIPEIPYSGRIISQPVFRKSRTSSLKVKAGSIKVQNRNMIPGVEYKIIVHA